MSRFAALLLQKQIQLPPISHQRGCDRPFPPIPESLPKVGSEPSRDVAHPVEHWSPKFSNQGEKTANKKHNPADSQSDLLEMVKWPFWGVVDDLQRLGIQKRHGLNHLEKVTFHESSWLVDVGIRDISWLIWNNSEMWPGIALHSLPWCFPPTFVINGVYNNPFFCPHWPSGFRPCIGVISYNPILLKLVRAHLVHTANKPKWTDHCSGGS